MALEYAMQNGVLCFLAQVHRDNPASMKLFGACSFVQTGADGDFCGGLSAQRRDRLNADICSDHKQTMFTALCMEKVLDARPVYMKRPLSLEGPARQIFQLTALRRRS